MPRPAQSLVVERDADLAADRFDSTPDKLPRKPETQEAHRPGSDLRFVTAIQFTSVRLNAATVSGTPSA